MSKFEVGDKVRVISQDNDHVSTIAFVSDNLSFPYKLSTANSGWLNAYADRELELVITKEGTKPMARRTFKLLKDTPDVKKGALYQEQCDDGTQPYELLTKGNHTDGDASSVYVTRSIVEDQPQWFVEVFKVTPEYMTKNELDKWNEFNKKPVTRKYTMSAKAIKSRKENAAKRRKTTSRGKSNV